MKRHESLRPLSRDHHHALVEARAIRWALSGRAGNPELARTSLLRVWEERLAPHFLAEEELLVPLIRDPADAARLRDDHTRLRALVQRLRNDTTQLGALAHELDVHVRWEERSLFPRVEAAASAAELAGVGARLHHRPGATGA